MNTKQLEVLLQICKTGNGRNLQRFAKPLEEALEELGVKPNDENDDSGFDEPTE